MLPLTVAIVKYYFNVMLSREKLSVHGVWMETPPLLSAGITYLLGSILRKYL